MEWKIGNVTIKNQVVMAPMAGVSSPAYMKICEEMGVGYAITELLSSEAIIRNNKKTFEMLNGIESIKIPVAFQIFGSNPDNMAYAASFLVEKYNAKIIDINMGCPVPKVALRSEAGAGLLKDLSLIEKIVTAVVKAVSVPVTVKIRSGWDMNSINAVEVAKLCEKCGAKAITIHGRTRSQLYSGQVSLDIIKEVKAAVNIPVIGNGDINSCESAKKMLDYTSCDAIMIGRALMGNPWIIKEINEYLDNGKIINKPTYEDKIKMCLYHLNYLLRNKNEKVALLEMRSHISWYVRGIPYHKEVQSMIFKATSIKEVKEILDNYLKKLYN